jgi:hypothetical protein
MSYDVITIDTQTVYKNQRALDRGYLAQLSQFKDGPVQVVLTEIVLRELHKMLIDKAQAPLDALAKVIRDGSDNGQLSSDHKASLQKTLDALAPAADHSKSQIKAFVDATGTDIIPADTAAMKEILAAYFGKKPPFSSKGKKDEFPDAISLLALETWAKQANKKVLAVSGDSDWKTFAEHSPHIDCVENLGDAIAAIVQAAQASVEEARSVLAAIASEEPPDLKNRLDELLASEVEDLTPYAEFDSAFEGEEQGVTLVLQHYNIEGLDDGSTPIDIVRIGPSGFVMRVPVVVTARAFVDISFSVRDWIDKDYVPIGSTSVEKDVEFEASALITCDRLSTDTTDELSYEITHAELVDTPLSIDLGHVNYSLADERDDFGPEDFQHEA